MDLDNAHFDNDGISYFDNDGICRFENDGIGHFDNDGICHFDNDGIGYFDNCVISWFENGWIAHSCNDCLLFWEIDNDGMFSVTTYKVHLFSFSELFEKLVNLSLNISVTNILYYIINIIIW